MRKSLIILSALLLAGIGARAQVTVIHECVADFDDWTIDQSGSSGDFHLNTWSTENEVAGMKTPFLEYWVYQAKLSPATISHKQLTGLETGYYTVSMDIRIINELNTSIGTGTLFKANDVSEDLDDLTQDGNEGTSGSNLEVYGNYSLTVQVTGGTLDISVVIPDDASYGWIAFKNLSVKYWGDVAPAHTCVADFSDWSIDKTGVTFQRNSWSTEADPSGMTTPYIEYWTGSGVNLSDATISHTQLTDLTAGYYEVSIFARAFNENSLVDVAEGITFNANGQSIDLNKETHATYNHVSAEEYGTYKVYCYVAEIGEENEGILDINFTLNSVNCDWLAFKNLDVAYCGTDLTDLPALTAAEGTMNSSIASAQTTALATYANEATLANYNAAYQAVESARVSAAFYADIAATLDELGLDEAGMAAFSASTNGAAYDANTLNYCDMTDTYVEAVKAQTTEGSDLTYAVANATWICEQGNGPTYMSPGYETYNGEGNYNTGKVMYQLLENLPVGYTYEVQFYAFARAANLTGLTSGSDIAVAYANDETTAMTVETDWDDKGIQDESYLHTFTVTVGSDGTLEYGIQNVAAGGNWYMADAKSLTLVELAEDPYIYDVTKLLANPSFEEDVMTGDFTDTNRNAYTASSLTGWDLVAPVHSNSSYPVSDLMTKEATATDNDFGVPGTPSDGTYMLYLRNAHAEQNSNTLADASVMQKITLPAGEYELAVDSKCVATDANAGTVTLVAGENSTTLSIHTDSKVPESWDTATLKFLLDVETEVTVGVNIEFTDGSTNYPLSVLLDNFRLYSETDVVEWTLGADYGTLILPFAADVPTGLTAYEAGTVSNDELSLTEVGSTLSANTPYIIGGEANAQTTYYFAGVPENGSTTSYGNTLVGVLPAVTTTEGGYTATTPEAVEVESGSYVLQLQDEEVGPAFYLVESDETITCGAYHCYLDGNAVSANAKAVRLVFDDVATAIEAVEATEETGSETVYDLSGRRVAKAQKGVYIVNGKKMVIK